MRPTPSSPTSNACAKCHSGYLVIDLLRDEELGTFCQARKCVQCGCYCDWGPMRGLTWPLSS